MDPIVKQLHLHPRFHGIVFRRTFRELEESLIPRAKYLYARFGGVGSDGGKVFTFPSGAVIRMSYLATDDDAHSHQSAEYNYAAFDELTHFTRYQYFYVYTRVRSSVTGLPSYMRGASNPGGPGHTWVFKEFVEPCESGHVLLKRTMPNGKVERSIFIPAKLTDNKVLLKNDPSYENNLMMLPEAEKRALLYGDWHAFSGQVFSEFRAKRIPTEPDNALHVIEPFDIPEWWPKMVIADWGFTAMTWVGFLAISPDDRAILYREYSCKKKYIAEWGADILESLNSMVTSEPSSLTPLVGLIVGSRSRSISKSMMPPDGDLSRRTMTVLAVSSFSTNISDGCLVLSDTSPQRDTIRIPRRESSGLTGRRQPRSIIPPLSLKLLRRISPSSSSSRLVQN